MARGVATALAAAACACVLPSALAQPAQFSFRSSLERLPGATLGYRLENLAAPIGLVALRGGDFTINGATVLRAGGGSAVCSVSGNPPTLTCRNFVLQKGQMLVALLSTTRPATRAEQAITEGTEPRATSFFPVDVGAAEPHGSVQFKRTSATRTLIIGANTGFVGFTKIHVFVPTRARARVESLRVIRAPQLSAQRASAAAPRCTKRHLKKKKKYRTAEDEVACIVKIAQGELFYFALRHFGAGVSNHMIWETADGKVYIPTGAR